MPMSFLMANGSHDSHAITLADGNHNGSRKAGTPYQTITWGGIRRLMDAPTAVEKDDAPFVILSAYNEHDGRTHDVQRERGVYGGLAIDIDKGDPSIEEVIDAVQAVVGDAGLEVYSSSSAAADNRKWRVLIPLAAPLAGSEYHETQDTFFSLLAKHGLQCDTTLARPGQPIYLPNVPEGRRDDHGRPLFYARRHVDGPALELGPKSAIVDAVEHNREQHARLKAEAAEAAAERAAKRSRYAPAGDDTSPIDQFNENHDIGSLLLRYGFERREGGERDHYRHPGLGNSGSYSMEDMGGHWVCMSDWAKGCKLGGTSRSGFQFGDAFDLFTYFEHGNDRKAAVRAYGLELRERSQREAMPAKVTADEPTVEAEPLTTAVAITESGAANVGKPETLTDVGLGRRIVCEAAGRVRYVIDRGIWVRWTGTHWEDDAKALEMRRVAKLVASKLWQEMMARGPDRTGVALFRFVQAAASRRSIDAAISLAASEPDVEARSTDFDTDPDTLNVANGILDLRTLELRPHDPAALLTKLAPVNFDSSASAPKWWAFVDAVTCGDNQLAKFLQRSFGLALSADQSEQRLWMHWGEGSNGKGTALSVLNSVMGTYAGPAPIEVLLSKRGEGDREIGAAKLAGKRLAFAQEADDGARLSEAAVKALTGSDPMTGRYLYQNSFNFMPTWHIHLAVNDKPAIKGTDHGIWRRVTLVPWLHTFDGAAKRGRAEVEAELLAERSGILNWLLAGYTNWRSTGLQPPDAVTAATASYRADSDSVRAWMDDACVVDVSAVAGATDLFNDYTHWCQRAGHGKGVSQSKFGKTLDRLGHIRDRPTGGEYRFKVVRIGLRLADVHSVHS